jgi:alpha-tubulin suppressor-like RCC1 family protein
MLALRSSGAVCAAALVACGSNGEDAGPVDASIDTQAPDRSAEAPSSADSGAPADDGPGSDSPAPSDAAPEAAFDAGGDSGGFLVDAVDLSIGGDTACAVRQNGAVVCWGSNLVTSKVVWPVAAGPVVVQKVAVYSQDVCMLDTQGGVWCLGYNFEGLLGNGMPTDLSIQKTPSQVIDATNQPIHAVALGGASLTACALRADGSVVCWGADEHLQLGQDLGMVTDSGVTYSSVAIPVPGVSFPAGMLPRSFGDFACAGGTGGITCWGLDTQFECLTSSVSPTAFNPQAADTLTQAGASMPVQEIALGYVHGCVLDHASRIFCWGWDSAYPILQPLPHAVNYLADAGVTSIAAGDGWTCALDGEKHVQCFGENHCQLGSGQIGEAGVPDFATVVDIDGGGALSGVGRIYAGGISCAILAPGSQPGPVVCWGYGPDVGGTSTATTGIPQPVLLP